jgi:hypothetical protein
MNLTAIVLALWFSISTSTAPPAGICVDPPETRAPACELAETIGDVAEAHPLWEGDDGKRATALMLGAIARHESSLDPRVLACDRRGDGGLSVTAFQLRRGSWFGLSAAALCGDSELAARVALGHLRRSANLSKTWSGEGLLLNYGGWVRPIFGGPPAPTRGGREIAKAWQAAMNRFGIREARLVRRVEEIRLVVPEAYATGT